MSKQTENIVKTSSTFSHIKDAFSILAVLSTFTMGVYEYAQKKQVKNESAIITAMTAKHADSIAIALNKNMDKMIIHLEKNDKKDSLQIDGIKKLTNSTQRLAGKILTKDELYIFMQPYINLNFNKYLEDEKKNLTSVFRLNQDSCELTQQLQLKE